MKRHLFLFLLGTIFLTIQTTLLSYLPIERFRPDILLALILFWGFTLPSVSGGLHSLLIGYLMDLFSGNCFGLYTFTRPLLFYLAQLFRGRFYLESFLPQFLFAFLFALFEGLLILALLSVLNPAPLRNLYPRFVTFYLPQSFFTGGITPALFLLLQRMVLFLPLRQGVAPREWE